MHRQELIESSTVSWSCAILACFQSTHLNSLRLLLRNHSRLSFSSIHQPKKSKEGMNASEIGEMEFKSASGSGNRISLTA